MISPGILQNTLRRKLREITNCLFPENWSVCFLLSGRPCHFRSYIFDRRDGPPFVFSIRGPKQNARSPLTPVSETVFYLFSHGSLHFVLHGSFNYRLFQRFWLVVEKFWPIRKWLKKLPWTAKPRLPVKEHKQLYQKQMSKVTSHFVRGHQTRKQTVWRLLWTLSDSSSVVICHFVNYPREIKYHQNEFIHFTKYPRFGPSII